MATVDVGSRLHFGFQNLSLAHDRLYGGVGVALSAPRLVVEATRADDIDAPELVESSVRTAVETLDVPGATVTIHERFQRHVGFGSGTQLALGCFRAIAAAYDREADVREGAPALGRGGRSGVGVATFERGGFVIDAGHATERFSSDPPAAGTWRVPQPIVAQQIPDSWRFLLVTPDVEPGQHGDTEDRSMQSVVERADPGIADQISTVLTRRLLPALAEDDAAVFGSAVARLSRLNGAWYADEQGGVYRPPAGTLVEALGRCSAIAGAGQSSWGPTVYGLTTGDEAEVARRAAADALDAAGLDGTVRVVAGRNHGALVEQS
jgi:beta-ribofuranosylaminobenzene 5'-phosphate synthase